MASRQRLGPRMKSRLHLAGAGGWTPALEGPAAPPGDLSCPWSSQHGRESANNWGAFVVASTVYRVIEVIGVSSKSWEDAARSAVETAAGSVRDLRIAEVTKLDVTIDDGKVASFRARLNLSFKYESGAS